MLRKTPLSYIANGVFWCSARLHPKTLGLPPGTAANGLGLQCGKASPVSIKRWELVSLLAFSSSGTFSTVLFVARIFGETIVKGCFIFLIPWLSMGLLHDSSETWASTNRCDKFPVALAILYPPVPADIQILLLRQPRLVQRLSIWNEFFLKKLIGPSYKEVSGRSMLPVHQTHYMLV